LAVTGTEIITTASSLTEGDTVDNTNGLIWINECIILDLAKVAKAEATASISATEDTFTDLPSDFLEMYEIMESGKTYPYWGQKYGAFYDGLYDIRNGQIRFPKTATFTIYYYKIPAALSALSSTIPTNDRFKYVIAIWVAKRHKFYYDERSQGAKDMMAQYTYWRDRVAAELGALRPTTTSPKTVRKQAWR